MNWTIKKRDWQKKEQTIANKSLLIKFIKMNMERNPPLIVKWNFSS